MPRFQIDERSKRGIYSRSNVEACTILVDGQDRGISVRYGDYDAGCSVLIAGHVVAQGLLTRHHAIDWLEANLATLPPLVTEQFELEV